MKNTHRYSVTTVPDNEEDKFLPSLCKCTTCSSMHAAILEWDTFTATTALQRKMKSVISKIENDIKSRQKK